LPKFAKNIYAVVMYMVTISLPEDLKAFVEGQAVRRGYGTSGEYVRELIRKDHDRSQFRALLHLGVASAPTAPIDAGYFESLRNRVRKATKATARN
jgi:antitoxin ParD1/3/4